jgi:hypothetical protein
VKRSPELAPLSRDHHVALEHALRLRRATPEDVATVVAAFLAFVLGPGRSHFAQEEHLLAPAVPTDAAELRHRMLREHEEILRRAESLGLEPEADEAHELGDLLARHVRFEERELFPLIEARLPGPRLREIAHGLSRA